VPAMNPKRAAGPGPMLRRPLLPIATPPAETIEKEIKPQFQRGILQIMFSDTPDNEQLVNSVNVPRVEFAICTGSNWPWQSLCER